MDRLNHTFNNALLTNQDFAQGYVQGDDIAFFQQCLLLITGADSFGSVYSRMDQISLANISLISLFEKKFKDNVN